MNTSDFVTNVQSRMQMEIRDEDKLYRYNGVLYPQILCPEENVNALQNIEARENDITLVAYPKCGEVGDWKNHFTQEQSREMDDAFNKHLAGTRLGDKLNYQLYCQ